MKSKFFKTALLLCAFNCFAFGQTAPAKPQTTTQKPAPNVIIKYDTERQYYYIANADNGNIIKILPYQKVTDFKEGMALITTESGVGFINTKGIEVVPPNGKYKFAEDFSGGLAVVGTTNEAGERKTAGFINKTGAVVIPLTYQDAKSFSENLAAIKKGDKWGFIDKKGTLIIPFSFTNARKFKYGLAAVCKKTTSNDQTYEFWGYIDKTGKTAISFKFSSAGEFHNTNPDIYEAIVENDDEMYLIDKKGNETDFIDYLDPKKFLFITTLQWVSEDDNLLYVGAFDRSLRKTTWGVYHSTGMFFISEPEYKDIQVVYEPATNNKFFLVESNWGWKGLIKHKSDYIPAIYDIIQFNDTVVYAACDVKVENKQIISAKYSLFDLKMNRITKYKYNESYDLLTGFFEGLAKVKRNGKFGFINKKGEEIIPLEYDETGLFSNGIAAVVKSGKTGAINKKNELIIPIEYQALGTFINGFASYWQNGLVGIIDITGKKITEPIFENMGQFSQGLAPVVKDKKIGYVNTKGDFVIQPIYDDGFALTDSLAQVAKDKKYGFIDLKGNEVIPFKYDYSDGFKNGMTVVMEGDKYFLIDKKGKVIKKY